MLLQELPVLLFAFHCPRQHRFGLTVTTANTANRYISSELPQFIFVGAS
jgi:hypothetical protein